ncbi:lipid II flippase Amj family protein [Altererythrobacter sp. CC-YST694]|uniref:lipid II flippase Amj family protein n=1 Tax=Altererythrobacter sp. CC-YST694 TaxID=2755038 RepID=UPI001D024856|nr:lipid II flippase Amj family protein [Altererythrobacter sp. CC-YST694]MCB5423922.1 lipid II flippase Amj family protein [Altererythrobacter sp. CC-YST694]
MDVQLIVICVLTGVINLIGALAYAARIAGVRTRRIAMSFALFNILILVSRLSNGLLGPLVAKRIENAIAHGGNARLQGDFHLMLASASIAVLLGILLVPTAQRMFSHAIGQLQRSRSVGRLLLHSASPSGMRVMWQSLAAPHTASLRPFAKPAELGWGIVIANCLAQAILAVGVFASIYAGYLNPEYRVTASQLSAVINGFATILLFAFIDPHLSVITDDAAEGRVSEAGFRRVIVWISASRLAGTVLAQLLFLPAATAVAWISNYV